MSQKPWAARTWEDRAIFSPDHTCWCKCEQCATETVLRRLGDKKVQGILVNGLELHWYFTWCQKHSCNKWRVRWRKLFRLFVGKISLQPEYGSGIGRNLVGHCGRCGVYMDLTDYGDW